MFNNKVTEVQKLFFQFLIISLFGFFVGVLILDKTTTHTERLEWIIYILSTLFISMGALAVSALMKRKIINLTIYNKFLYITLIMFFLLITYFKLGNFINFYFLSLLLLSFLPTVYEIVYEDNDRGINRIRIYKGTKFWQIFVINNILIFVVNSYFSQDLFTGKIVLSVFVVCIILYLLLQKNIVCISHKLYSVHKLMNTKILFDIFVFVIMLILNQKVIDFHHYSFYIGPTFDVNNGKSILYDTPSQYGYLVIHFLVFLTKWIGNSFNTFHIINITLFTIYCMGEYLILSRLINNKFKLLIAIFVLISLQTLYTDYYTSLYPSTGPLRFGIGLLICWLLCHFQWRKSFVFGTLFASISLFWSVETAVYIVPAWLFTCIAQDIINYKFSKDALKKILYRLISFLCISILIFMVIIFIEYYNRKTFPDISAFYEYAISYGNGFGSLLIEPFGNHFLIILVLIIGLNVTFYIVVNGKKSKFANALIFMSIFNVLVFSYFIGRSHENNIINISPMIFIEVGLIYNVLIDSFNISYKEMERYLMIPFIIFTFLFFLKSSYHFSDVCSSIEVNAKSNINFLTKTKSLIEIIEDKYHLDMKHIVVLSKRKDAFPKDTQILTEGNKINELPLNPSLMTTILPNWKQKYIEPSIDRLQIGTVIIFDNDNNDDMNWIFKKIKDKYSLETIGEIKDLENMTFSIYRIDNIK